MDDEGELEEKVEKIIIKGKTPIKCELKFCCMYGNSRLCYEGEDRDCSIYKSWNYN